MQVEHTESRKKRNIGKLALAAGVVVLLAGVPSMAADRTDRPDTNQTLTASDASGIVQLESLNVSQTRQEKPKPKRRDPGRQNPSAPDSPCASSGFFGSLLGFLVNVDLGCDTEETMYPTPN